MKSKTVVLFWVLLVWAAILRGQGAAAPEVGLGFSATAYYGDLTAPRTAFSRMSPGGCLWLRLGGKAALRPVFQIGLGSFSDQLDEGALPEAPDVEPVLYVQTSFFYTDLRLEYHLLREKWVHPYLAAGLGLLFFSPKDEAGNFLGDNAFTRLPGERYPTTVWSFPLGLGTQIRLSERISTGLEYCFRPTSTDYLDNLGRMGYRPGNDALHHLQVSVWLRLPQDRGL